LNTFSILIRFEGHFGRLYIIFTNCLAYGTISSFVVNVKLDFVFSSILSDPVKNILWIVGLHIDNTIVCPGILDLFLSEKNIVTSDFIGLAYRHARLNSLFTLDLIESKSSDSDIMVPHEHII
jgi:hypothetical protein